MKHQLQTIRAFVRRCADGDTMPSFAATEALTALAEIERTHYAPADMADAQAKAFRAGVESMTAGQEPWVQWTGGVRPPIDDDAVFEYFTINGEHHGPTSSASRLDWTHDYHLNNSDIIAYRLCAAPVAQQPQAEAVPIDALGAEWTPCIKRPVIVHVRNQRPGEQHVSTREGITPVKPDDLIMRGVSGEEYPIGRAIFDKTYDLTNDARALPQQACHPAEDGVCERLDCENHQPAQAVPLLTDDEIDSVWDAIPQNQFWWRRYARAVEQAVRDKMGVAVPMTPKDYAAALDAAVDNDSVEEIEMWAFIEGIKAAEKFHGIVGKEGA